MKILDWLKGKPKAKPERGTDADKEMVRAAILKGKCPDCGSKDFIEGPSGGICTNYTCAECGSRFNIGAAFGSVMIADRIS
jgi:DNA-directed RNA polymerase subunit RPC12/RpoP